MEWRTVLPDTRSPKKLMESMGKPLNARNIIIIILLLLLVGDILFRKPEPLPPVVIENKAEVARIQAHVLNLEAQNRTLKNRREQDSLKEIATAARHNAEMKVLNRKLSAVPTFARATAPELDSIGEVLLPVVKTDTLYQMDIARARDAFSEVMRSRAKDPIILQQANRIVELEGEKTTLRVDLEAQIENANERSKDLAQALTVEQSTSEELEKRNRKLSRQKKVFKIVAPVAFVVGAAIGIFVSN